MAKNRTCDIGGEQFSEREPDWGEFRGTVHGRYEDGSQHDRTESIDACPSCTARMMGLPPSVPPVSRTMLTQAREAASTPYAPTVTQPPGGKKLLMVDAEEHDRYLQYLENQNGIGFSGAR